MLPALKWRRRTPTLASTALCPGCVPEHAPPHLPAVGPGWATAPGPKTPAFGVVPPLLTPGQGLEQLCRGMSLSLSRAFSVGSWLALTAAIVNLARFTSFLSQFSFFSVYSIGPRVLASRPRRQADLDPDPGLYPASDLGEDLDLWEVFVSSLGRAEVIGTHCFPQSLAQDTHKHSCCC